MLARRAVSTATPAGRPAPVASPVVTSAARQVTRPVFGGANTGRTSTVCNVSGRGASVNLFGWGGSTTYIEEEEVYDDEEYTVAKLQVGIFGDINKWQSRLDDVATKYDTGSETELHQIYMDALMLVLRNTEYVGYVSSGGKVFEDLGEAEQKYNSVLLEERLKFSEETLVNIDGRKKKRELDNKGDDKGLDRWLCMTMVMCVDGRFKIPAAESVYDLKKVLTEMGGIGAEDLVAFELLWTPQETDDYYSKDELLTDYPTMTTLS